MAVVKVIEVIAQSPKSWEDAAQQALTEVSASVRNVQSVYIQDLQAIVEEDKILEFRVNAKISFIVDK